MAPKLSVGFGLYEGVKEFEQTVQGWRMNNDFTNIEFVVVNQTPESKDARTLRNFVNGPLRTRTAGARYVEMADKIGVAPVRNAIAEAMAGDIKMFCDHHIDFKAGIFEKVIKLVSDPACRTSMFTGPVLNNRLDVIGTHLNPIWRKMGWGIWGKAWLHPDGKTHFSVIELDEKAIPVSLDMECKRLDKLDFPDIPYSGYEEALRKLNYVSLGDTDDYMLEIPGQGLGFFACHRDAWPGFNPLMRGFRCMELAFCEKFRQQGGKVICVTDWKWWHLWDKFEPAPFPVRNSDAARNAILAWIDMGKDPVELQQQFVRPGICSIETWDKIIKDPQKLPLPENHSLLLKPGRVVPQAAPDEEQQSINRELLTRQRGEENKDRPGVALSVLFAVASKCPRMVELSTHADSLVAIHSAQCTHTISYNLQRDDPLLRKAVALPGPVVRQTVETASPNPAFDQADGLYIDIPPYDGQTLYNRLTYFAPKIHRMIAIHRILDYPEMVKAVDQFLEENPKWILAYRVDQRHGIAVLSTDTDDRIIPMREEAKLEEPIKLGERPKLQMPSPLKRIANFTVASIGHLLKGSPNCTQEEIDERHKICLACPLFLVDKQNPEIGHCTHESCGCPITRIDKFVTKLGWWDAKCPLGKWRKLLRRK